MQMTTSRRAAMGLVGAGLLGAAATTQAAAQAPAVCQAPPVDGQIDTAVRAAHRAYRGLNEGANADYIPALAEVNSRFFGVSVGGADGRVHEAGDSSEQFSIQSISKVFTMALVMKEQGDQKIIDSVGVDATGQVFNSIEAVEQYRGKEMNPLVNPGAIATMGNVQGSSPDEVWNKVLAIHSEFAGRQLAVNEPVYQSEAATNQRNRAIASLMSAYERFPMDPLVACDLYTRACSINVSAHDLSVMAATLAYGGRNPVTGRQVIESSHVPGILSVMATAGLYDDSGKWLFKSGLPAKSGVGGGLIAVSPGKFGVGTFSPRLDEAGNSVRGQRAIIDISNALNGNPYAQFGQRVA